MIKSELFDKQLQELAQFAKVISHPARLSILQYLFNSPFMPISENHSFDGFLCEESGEMVVEKYDRIKGD